MRTEDRVYPIGAAKHIHHRRPERSGRRLAVRGISPAPVGGEHVRPLLRELGYAEADIDRMYAAGVVWSAPVVRERLG